MCLSRAAVFYEQFVLFINGPFSVQGRKLGLNISIPEQAAQFPEHGKWKPGSASDDFWPDLDSGIFLPWIRIR